MFDRSLRACLTCSVAALLVLAHSGCTDSRVAVAPGAQGGAGGQGGAPAAAGVTSRGDFGDVDDGKPDSCPDGVREDGRRCISDLVLRRRGVAYSGYRLGQSPMSQTFPSEAEITEDLKLLMEGGWTFIRLFDSGPHAETVLKVIRDNELDMKVQLGVWIDGPKAKKDAANRKQIESGVALASTYPEIIVGISVGNEVLDDWSSVLTPAEDLAAYISEVRERTVVPVATDDMYPPLLISGNYSNVEQVVAEVDYLSLHVYAILDAPWSNWDYGQLSVPAGPERAAAMMDAALAYTKKVLNDVRTYTSGKGYDVPVLIGEVGWKSRPTKTAEPLELSMAHPVNQKMFYQRLMDWAHGAGKDETSPSAVFYFSSFDEPWKTVDDGWGLFDTNRQAKYVLWDVFPERKPAEEPEYTESDAVYYAQ